MNPAYQKLLDDWRAAADDTRKAQQALKLQFDLFLQGKACEPGEADIHAVQRLRQAELERLKAAMAFVRDSAHGRG
jgi:hypothetical protein